MRMIVVKQASKIVGVILGFVAAIMFFLDNYLKTYLNNLPPDKSIIISNIIAHYDLWASSLVLIATTALLVSYYIK